MQVMILGAGLAGWAVADALNELAPQFGKTVHPDDGIGYDKLDMDNTILLSMITADKGDRYHKPMLSSAFGQGKTAQELVRMDGKTSAQKANLHLENQSVVCDLWGSSAHLRPTKRGGSAMLGFNKLVLALGASPVVPTALQRCANVFDINHLDAFKKLRQHLADKDDPTILIVGAGMVGLELCEDLRNFKPNAHIVLASPTYFPLPSIIREQGGIKQCSEGLWGVGARLVSLLKEKLNITYLKESSVAWSDGKRVILTSNDAIDCDAVVLATGLRVNKELIGKIVPCDERLGVAVNEYNLQSVDNPNVYAIGDCMNIDGQTSRFVAPLKAQARAIALDILGQTGDYVHKPPMIRLKNKVFTFVVNGKISDEQWVKEVESDSEMVFVQPSGAKLQLRW